MTYMARPQHKNPCPGVQEFYNFGRAFFGHYYCLLSFSDLSLGIEKKILQEIHQFYTFYPQTTSPWGEGSWNLQFLVFLPYRCYIPILVKIGPVVLVKKILTDDERRTPQDTRRQTPTHSNRPPEWLGWPKYRAVFATSTTWL